MIEWWLNDDWIWCFVGDEMMDWSVVIYMSDGIAFNSCIIRDDIFWSVGACSGLVCRHSVERERTLAGRADNQSSQGHFENQIWWLVKQIRLGNPPLIKLLHINSSRLKSFRSFVRGYTGQQKNPAVRDHIKYSNELHQEKKQKLVDFLESLEIEAKSEHEITQYLRG